jgi:hypothetical protein
MQISDDVTQLIVMVSAEAESAKQAKSDTIGRAHLAAAASFADTLRDTLRAATRPDGKPGPGRPRKVAS